jgi:hypothetical protein
MGAKLDNSILCGEYVYARMTSYDELVQLVDKNIYPLIAPADTTFPFVVFKRSIIPTYTKDMLCSNTVTFEIIVASDDYTNSLYTANAVRHSLECYSYGNETLRINKIKITDITEETNDDTFIQRILISCIVE